MRLVLISLLIVAGSRYSTAIAQQSVPPKPPALKALLITGGCCHDYERQKSLLTEGISARAQPQWTIATEPFPDAHFATFPKKLVEPCVLAGTKQGDVVLDPFHGAGTVGVVAQHFGRRYVGIELSEAYITMSLERLTQTALPL